MKFSNTDLKNIIKCLLFTSTSDSCLDNQTDDENELRKLAIKIANKNNLTDLTDTNLYICDECIYDNPENVKELLNTFKINLK